MRPVSSVQTIKIMALLCVFAGCFYQKESNNRIAISFFLLLGGVNLPRGGKRDGSGRPKSEVIDDRTRNWNFILYPESAPDNWRDMIDETHIEWIESPLHDKDIDPTGEQKKAHHHVTLLFPTNQSYRQVKELTDSLNAPIPIKCKSVKGSIRYMVHKDNPDKYQYFWNDIVCHGGADLSDLCAPTATERMQIQQDILSYIRDNNIIEFADIVDYACLNGLDDWLNVMLNYSTLSINAYVRSRRHKSEVGLLPKVDPETGEVIE